MRFILGFIGAVFAAILLLSMISNLATYFSNPPAPLASDEFHQEPKELHLAERRPVRQVRQARSCSAASRSIRRSARPATA